MDKSLRPYAPGPLGLSLPASLRWGPALLFLVALFTATLVACGENSSSAEHPTREVVTADTPDPTPEPTPDVQMQKGAELTTEEYAEAMEELASSTDADDEIEAAAADVFSGDLFSSDEEERVYALETNDSWSREDVEFASEVAKILLAATAGVFEVILRVSNESLDEVASLRPPEHLTDLHSDYVTTLREVLQLVQAQAETVKNASTEIKSREELADFQAIVNSLESGSSDAALEQKAEELTARVVAACRALREQLETDVKRDVSICGN